MVAYLLSLGSLSKLKNSPQLIGGYSCFLREPHEQTIEVVLVANDSADEEHLRRAARNLNLKISSVQSPETTDIRIIPDGRFQDVLIVILSEEWFVQVNIHSCHLTEGFDGIAAENDAQGG